MRSLLRVALSVSLLVACNGNGGGPTGTSDATDAGGAGSDSAIERPVSNDAGSPIGDDAGAVPFHDAGIFDAGAYDAALPVDSASSPGPDAASEGGSRAQALAIPLYMDPSAAGWAQETSAASDVPLVVANPNSGPGASADPAYTQAIATAHSAGQTIIGYIHTSYGARAIADVEADIDAWYSFYPAVDGIFSDETATSASLVGSYYAPLYAYVKGKAGKAEVVINPGTPPDESYMTASDVVLAFEDTYANYGALQIPSWVAGYPSARFWHIVLSATQTQMESAVTLARQRNAGLVYVTDQGPATAYQQLVTGAYWQAELAAVNAP